LKTININLIGTLGKTQKSKDKLSGKYSNAGTQIYSWILVIATLIVFVISFGSWIAVKNMSQKLSQNLSKVENNIINIEKEETRLNLYRKGLKNDKEAAELKLVIRKTIEASFLPWKDILGEIAEKIPKDVVVLNIEKAGNPKDEIFGLKISGIIPANKKIKPLITASLFIFNLNNDTNSLLYDAKITNLNFNEKTQAYEFEIETSIKRQAKDE